jgi:hypothetical protein
MVVVVNDEVAREGADAGILESTRDGYRFTDAAMADIEMTSHHRYT